MQILEELYNETRRIFIAGSRLAKGDPRITKYIPTLQKLGEKSPIMKKLADKYTALTESGDPAALIEAGTFLQSVKVTQASTSTDSPITERATTINDKLPNTIAQYSVLSPVLAALKGEGDDRLGIITRANEGGYFNDFRLIRPAALAIDDRSSDIRLELVKNVLPNFKAYAIPHIVEIFDPEEKTSAATKLKLLCEFQYEGAEQLVNNALAEGSVQVKAEAIAQLYRYEGNEKLLLQYSKDKKKEFRVAALTALSKMMSEQGFDQILEDIKPPKISVEALTAIEQYTDKRFVSRIILLIEGVLDNLETTSTDIVYEDITIMCKSLEEKLNSLASYIVSYIPLIKIHNMDEQNEYILAINQRIVDTCNDILAKEDNTESAKHYKAFARAVMVKMSSTLSLPTTPLEAVERFANFDYFNINNYQHVILRAKNHYPPKEFYEKYSGHYVKQSHRCLTHDALTSYLLGNENYKESVIEHYSRLDPRWLDAFMEAKHISPKVPLLHLDQKRVEQYILDMRPEDYQLFVEARDDVTGLVNLCIRLMISDPEKDTKTLEGDIKILNINDPYKQKVLDKLADMVAYLLTNGLKQYGQRIIDDIHYIVSLMGPRHKEAVANVNIGRYYEHCQKIKDAILNYK